MSGFSILSALALMGGATFAFFSDQGTSTNNVFAAGNLDLKLDDSNEGVFVDNVTASLGGPGMAPGTFNTGFVSLHNNGSVAIAEVELGATQTLTSDNGTPSNLSDVLNLTVKTGTNNICTAGDIDRTPAMTLALGNNSAPLTLTELVNQDYDALPGLGSDYFLCVTATMDSGASNAYQGDSVTIDFTFTANQDVSQ